MNTCTTTCKKWCGMLPIGFALLLSLPVAQADLPLKTGVELAAHCPPYFRLDSQNRCQLTTLYDAYPSANEKWGGYRIALPPRRDGFSPQQIDLGRYLFFDPILSEDGRLSCAHCHHPQFNLGDGRATSIGRNGNGLGPTRKGGENLNRGAPGLWNLAFQQTFFWDSRVDSLESQIEIVLHNAQEMATTPEAVVARINAVPEYHRLFQQAFGVDRVDYTVLLTALTAFESSIVSLNSRYDHYIHGAREALSEQELNGLHIFRSFASRCSQCHTPPLFTSGQLATTGVPAPPHAAFDSGAQAITGEATLRGAFKVPSVRNVALTAPYMHAGQFGSLHETIAFYNAEPGHAVASQSGLTMHWHMVNPNLRDDEIDDLVAFLGALTDNSALPAIPLTLPSGHVVPRCLNECLQ